MNRTPSRSRRPARARRADHGRRDPRRGDAASARVRRFRRLLPPRGDDPGCAEVPLAGAAARRGAALRAGGGGRAHARRDGARQARTCCTGISPTTRGSASRASGIPACSSSGPTVCTTPRSRSGTVVDYAADRGIRVVPEFDMPGHSIELVRGIPVVRERQGPIRHPADLGRFRPRLRSDARVGVPVPRRLHRRDERRSFPMRFWHIGGDEVPGTEWNANPADPAWMKAPPAGKDNAALQAYFNRRLIAILAAPPQAGGRVG